MSKKRIADLTALVLCLIYIAVCTSGTFAVNAFAASKSSSSGFIHTSGQKIVDENGKDLLIKAIAFGNNVWINPDTPPESYTNESSYKELSRLGFNAVRFYLNYGLFESDSAPYKYKQTGFDWIDKHIAWAKKHNIRLILNIHYPQGGYQSNGEGDKLWTDKENQKRLAALWVQIAKRYANEPTVMGYGLVNEPLPCAESVSDGMEQWRKLAQSLTDNIRKYDTNHIIFVEKIGGVKVKKTGEITWSSDMDAYKIYPKIKDSNVVYEFHTYDPFQYSHQGKEMDICYSYPDEERVIGAVSWLNSSGSENASLTEKDWQYLETPTVKITNKSYKVLGISFQASSIGRNGVCYGDDLTIYEYDESGALIKTYTCSGGMARGDFGLWSNDGSGTGTLSDNVGHNDKQSLCIKGTLSAANMGTTRVEAVQGHSYKAAGYVKVESASSGASVNVSLDMYDSTWTSVIRLDRDALENYVSFYTSYCLKNKLPMYCGEMGLNRPCYEDGRGGVQWVSDMIDILFKNNVGVTYHDYISDDFGFYYFYDNAPSVLYRNDDLAKVFAEKFGGKYCEAMFGTSKDISSLEISAISSKTYTGKARTPSVTIKDGGYTLVKGTDYTLSYKNNKNIGTSYVIIEGKGSYSGTKTVSFSIVPAAAVLKVSRSGERISFGWTAVSGAVKYQIYYSTDGGKSYKKLGNISGKSTSYSAKLPAGTGYMFKIRSYKTVNGKTFYSSWSKTVTVK